jgi:hypothetical protein
MLRRYLDDDRQQATRERGVFYVDNHLRPYTGQHVVRKGWRMQDRRVRPGVSDYYVHDADGRPLFRIDVPSHDSLAMWMMPIVNQSFALSSARTIACSSLSIAVARIRNRSPRCVRLAANS